MSVLGCVWTLAVRGPRRARRLVETTRTVRLTPTLRTRLYELNNCRQSTKLTNGQRTKVQQSLSDAMDWSSPPTPFRRQAVGHLNKAHVPHNCCACIPICVAVPANQKVSILSHASGRVIDTASGKAGEANPAVQAIQPPVYRWRLARCAGRMESTKGIILNVERIARDVRGGRRYEIVMRTLGRESQVSESFQTPRLWR